MPHLYNRVLRHTGAQTRGLVFWLLAVTLLLSVVYHLFEVVLQPGVTGSYLRSLMDIFILLLSGFDLERQPVTAMGWTAAILLLVTNLLFIGTVIQGLGEIIMKAQSRRMSGMQNARFSGHTLVFGLTQHSRRIIDLYLSNVDRYQTRIVLVDDNLETLPPAYAAEADWIEFVRGNPFDEATLIRAGLRKASAAIVCPRDDGPAAEADSYAILVALAVERLNPDVVTTLILRDRTSRVFLEKNTDNGKIQISVDQVICPDEIVEGLTASAALNPGLSSFILDVLTFADTDGDGEGESADDNIIVVEEIPDTLFSGEDWRSREMDFRALVDRYLEVEGGILLGLSGEGGQEVLPRGGVRVGDRKALALKKESS